LQQIALVTIVFAGGWSHSRTSGDRFGRRLLDSAYCLQLEARDACGDIHAAAGKTYIAGPSDAKFPDKSDALPHRLLQEQSIDLSFIGLGLSERRTRRRQDAACGGIRPAASS